MADEKLATLADLHKRSTEMGTYRNFQLVQVEEVPLKRHPWFWPWIISLFSLSYAEQWASKHAQTTLDHALLVACFVIGLAGIGVWVRGRWPTWIAKRWTIWWSGCLGALVGTCLAAMSFQPFFSDIPLSQEEELHAVERLAAAGLIMAVVFIATSIIRNHFIPPRSD